MIRLQIIDANYSNLRLIIAKFKFDSSPGSVGNLAGEGA